MYVYVRISSARFFFSLKPRPGDVRREICGSFQPRVRKHRLAFRGTSLLGLKQLGHGFEPWRGSGSRGSNTTRMLFYTMLLTLKLRDVILSYTHFNTLTLTHFNGFMSINDLCINIEYNKY